MVIKIRAISSSLTGKHTMIDWKRIDRTLTQTLQKYSPIHICEKNKIKIKHFQSCLDQYPQELCQNQHSLSLETASKILLGNQMKNFKVHTVQIWFAYCDLCANSTLPQLFCAYVDAQSKSIVSSILFKAVISSVENY